MPAQLARYDALGIRYAKQTTWPAPEANKRTSHQMETCGGGYLLSLEDDAPIAGKRAVWDRFAGTMVRYRTSRTTTL